MGNKFGEPHISSGVIICDKSDCDHSNHHVERKQKHCFCSTLADPSVVPELLRMLKLWYEGNQGAVLASKTRSIIYRAEGKGE